MFSLLLCISLLLPLSLWKLIENFIIFEVQTVSNLKYKYPEMLNRNKAQKYV